jgi:nucleotide-binding universal stress UspA family protein
MEVAMAKYASLTVAAVGGDDDPAALGLAASLAAGQGAALRVMMCFPEPAADLVAWGGMSGVYVSQEVLDTLATVDKETRDRIRAQAELAAAKAGIGLGPAAAVPRMEVEERALAPWLALIRQLPLTDLVVMGARAARGRALDAGPLAAALMSGRAPVLLARNDQLPAGSTVAIAWDASLEAGRAVRAALPLLQVAGRVVILQDQDELDADERGDADPRRLAAYLAIHGVHTVDVRPVIGGRVGHALISASEREGAALLVAGAYGHARLREWVFGGATRAFLDADSGPHLLIAH